MKNNQFCLNCHFCKGGPKLKITAGIPAIKWPKLLSCHQPGRRKMGYVEKDLWCKNWKSKPKNKA
jgi:hypothetical protein